MTSLLWKLRLFGVSNVVDECLRKVTGQSACGFVDPRKEGGAPAVSAGLLGIFGASRCWCR